MGLTYPQQKLEQPYLVLCVCVCIARSTKHELSVAISSYANKHMHTKCVRSRARVSRTHTVSKPPCVYLCPRIWSLASHCVCRMVELDAQKGWFHFTIHIHCTHIRTGTGTLDLLAQRMLNFSAHSYQH